jgi:hypothetical protein
MSAIRDDGGVKSYPSAWRDALHFLESVRRRAAYLQLDRSEGQPTRLVLMCEAGGMVPQLATVAHPFGVPVLVVVAARYQFVSIYLRLFNDGFSAA